MEVWTGQSRGSVVTAFAACLLLMAGACRQNDRSDAAAESATTAESTPAEPVAPGIPPDFLDFYTRFHADSAFQVSRIPWPLAGNYAQDSLGQIVDLRYRPEDWVMHRPLDLGRDFEREFQVVSPELITETVRARAGNYAITRRFALLSDGWNLTEYRVDGLGGG